MPDFDGAVRAIIREKLQQVRAEFFGSLREERTKHVASGLAGSSSWKGVLQELSEKAVGSVADLVWTTVLEVGPASPQPPIKEREEVAVRVFREEIQWIENAANQALVSPIGPPDKIDLAARRLSAENALTAKAQLMEASPQLDSSVHSPQRDPRIVWVVSGRNSKARAAALQFLRSLDLAPMEWSDAVAATGQGAPFIGNVIQVLATAQAIIVLLTGDDYVQLHPDLAAVDDQPYETSPQLQPRPNVVFEAGMALGNPDTYDRTILVQLGTPKSFSDIAGRHYIKMNNSPQRRSEFADRLRTAGCPVRTSGDDWQVAGDFDSAILEEAQADAVPRANEKEVSSARGAPAIFRVRQSTLDSTPRTQLHMAAENGPGTALVRVENRGERAVFSASATVTDVIEQVSNPKFLQTYSLRWRSNDKNEMTLETGEPGSLLVASTGPTITRPASRDLCELLLQGYVGGQAAVMDRFRWHSGDPPGAVTVHLAVILSSPSAPGVVVSRFIVSSMEWGGVRIEIAGEAV